ncbi:hypothetical protein TWF696_001531 [Orbilia brochopaga]|uniref:Uncharacterized protein n=1 Tax=Orbilia brochopaga TaxID=3140254 RepID=A0AAV9U8Y4_9PEZI
MKFIYTAALLLASSMAAAAPAMEESGPLVSRQVPSLPGGPDLTGCGSPIPFVGQGGPWTNNSDWGRQSLKAISTTTCASELGERLGVTTIKDIYDMYLNPTARVWAASIFGIFLDPTAPNPCGMCIAPLKEDGTPENFRLYVVNNGVKQTSLNAFESLSQGSKGCWQPVPLKECFKAACTP